MLCILPRSAQDKEPRVQYSSVSSLQSSSRSKVHDSNPSVFAWGRQTRHNRFFCVCLAGGVASSDVVGCVRWGANTAKTPIRLIADPLAFQRKTHISKSRPTARAVAETQRHFNRQGSLDYFFCRSCSLRDVHDDVRDCGAFVLKEHKQDVLRFRRWSRAFKVLWIRKKKKKKKSR